MIVLICVTIVYMVVPYKKIFRVTLAALLFIIGILGLILPILNGIFFIVIALIVLSLEVPTLEVYLDKLGRKHNKVNHIYLKCKHFIHKHL